MQIDDLTLRSGVPVYFEDLDLFILQPKLRQIAELGEKSFYSGLSIMMMDGDSLTSPDKKEKIELTPYKTLIFALSSNPTLLRNFNRIASMFFNKRWAFDEESLQLKLIDKEEQIIISDEQRELLDTLSPEEVVEFYNNLVKSRETIIPEEKWDELCDIIREIAGLEKKIKPVKKKAKSKKAQAILDKIAESQQKIDKAKSSKPFEPYLWNSISTLSTGDQIPINFILDNYTIVQLNEQLKRCINKEESNKQFSIMLQGVKLEKPMVNWIGKI